MSQILSIRSRFASLADVTFVTSANADSTLVLASLMFLIPYILVQINVQAWWIGGTFRLRHCKQTRVMIVLYWVGSVRAPLWLCEEGFKNLTRSMYRPRWSSFSTVQLFWTTVLFGGAYPFSTPVRFKSASGCIHSQLGFLQLTGCIAAGGTSSFAPGRNPLLNEGGNVRIGHVLKSSKD